MVNTMTQKVLLQYSKIDKSLCMWSGKAPAGPKQEQSTGIQGKNHQVEAEQEAVELRAEGQPIGLSWRLTVLLG